MQPNEATWMPISDAPGYEVSDDGQVRGPHGEKAQYLSRDGYPRVNLSVEDKQLEVEVHALVLAAFVRPREPGEECRHLDGNPENNRLDNLAWGSHSENISDQVRHGTHLNARKTHCPQGHPYDEANTYRWRNTRLCRACNRQHQAKYQQRKAENAKRDTP